MIDKLCTKLVKYLFKKKIINSDYDKYLYGFQLISYELLNFSTIIVIGIFLDELLLSIMYLFLFSIYRIYMGGYHASKHLYCYCLTITLYLAFLFLVYCFDMGNYSTVLFVLSNILLVYLAPVDTKIHRLSIAIKREYKKTIILICSSSIILSLLFRNEYIECIKIVSICESILCIIQYIINVGERKNEINS